MYNDRSGLNTDIDDGKKKWIKKTVLAVSDTARYPFEQEYPIPETILTALVELNTGRFEL